MARLPVRWAVGCCALVVSLSVAHAWADSPPPPHHWGYSGEEAPSHWGDVSAVCAQGRAQSPIGFNSRGAITRGPFPKMVIDWKAVTAEAVDNGHTVQVNVPPGSSLTYGGTAYALKQLHFHSPSEHNVNGVHTAMEIHFVHQTPEGKTLVLAVLLTDGGANVALAPILSSMPPATGVPQTVQVDLPALLPKERAHFAYPGSLTTPPCTEGVQWLVIVAQPSISKEQVAAFRARFPPNARPTQAWHGRPISIAP